MSKPTLNPQSIDRHAREIVSKLQKSGHTTYLVGGCVRDLLAGIQPKDYDIATNAEPDQVRRKIPGSYVIGRRFRLVLVKRGPHQYEVATFRRSSQPEDEVEGVEIQGDNLFGTPEQDALRRDFTINALFYDPVKEELIDHAAGLKDVENSLLRMIGDPALRIQEDPIRTLRAVRLSHKLGFQIEPELRAAIASQSEELNKAILPRKREEYLKILKLKDPARAFFELHDLGVLKHTLPFFDEILKSSELREIFSENFLFLRKGLTQEDSLDLYFPFLWSIRKAAQMDAALIAGWENFLKDQLGVFKAEAASLHIAFEMSERLPRVESFLKRGQKRQENFMKSDWLIMAVRLALHEWTLETQDRLFWSQVLEDLTTPGEIG